MFPPEVAMPFTKNITWYSSEDSDSASYVDL